MKKQTQPELPADSVEACRLLESSRPRLEALIRSRIDAATARVIGVDDILQRTFLDIWRKYDPGNFHSPTQFAAWAQTIAISRVRDARRKVVGRSPKLKKTPVTPPSTASTIGCSGLSKVFQTESTPSQRVLREEKDATVREAMNSLPASQRKALLLRYEQNLTLAEVAEAMNCTPAAVHMLCQRGQRRLSELLPEPSSIRWLIPRRGDRGVPAATIF